MADLISREALLERLNDWFIDEDDHESACYNYGVKMARAVVAEVAGVDAVPVVHGRWITTRTYMHDGELYCSVCEEEAPSEYGRYTYIRSDYCPNCGAKMDLEEEWG